MTTTKKPTKKPAGNRIADVRLDRRRLDRRRTLIGVGLSVAGCVAIGLYLAWLTSGNEAVHRMLSANFYTDGPTVQSTYSTAPLFMFLFAWAAVFQRELLRRTGDPSAPVTYVLRLDLVLAAGGGAIVGTCWTGFPATGNEVFFGFGVLLLALGVLAALNFWRSGEVMSANQSVSLASAAVTEIPKKRTWRVGQWWQWLLAAATVFALGAIALAVLGPILVGSPDPAVQDWIYGGHTGDSARSVALGVGPSGLLMFAFAAGAIGEYARRSTGVSVQETPGLRGGTFRVRNRGLAFTVHLTWLGVGILVWGVVLLPPALLGPAGLSQASAQRVTEYWVLVGFNGYVAAAVAGAIGGSLVKKVFDARRTARGEKRVRGNSRGRRFWRFFSHRWRLDTWACALGAGTLGVSPLLLVSVVPWLGVVCVVAGMVQVWVGVVLVKNAWRSGVSIYELESLI